LSAVDPGSVQGQEVDPRRSAVVRKLAASEHAGRWSRPAGVLGYLALSPVKEPIGIQGTRGLVPPSHVT